MLRETYIANIKNLPKDLMVIEVTRNKGHPLSPSWELIYAYKNKHISWNEFVIKYKTQINNCGICKDIMKNIKEMAKKKDVYLCCYEKVGHCHRFILLDMIDEMKEE